MRGHNLLNSCYLWFFLQFYFASSWLLLLFCLGYGSHLSTAATATATASPAASPAAAVALAPAPAPVPAPAPAAAAAPGALSAAVAVIASAAASGVTSAAVAATATTTAAATSPLCTPATTPASTVAPPIGICAPSSASRVFTVPAMPRHIALLFLVLIQCKILPIRHILGHAMRELLDVQKVAQATTVAVPIIVLATAPFVKVRYRVYSGIMMRPA